MAEKMLNINLEQGKRKRFTIDGDENRILEINPADMGIFARIDDFDKAIIPALEEFSEKQFGGTEEDFDLWAMGKAMLELDKFVREQLDIMFDTNFSEIVAPYGTMLDPVNGDFRFQYLIEVFSKVYNDEFQKELTKRNDKIRERTKKYVNKVNKE